MSSFRRNFTESPSAYTLPVWATVALPRVHVTCDNVLSTEDHVYIGCCSSQDWCVLCCSLGSIYGHLPKAWPVTSPYRVVQGFGSYAARSGSKGFPLPLVLAGPSRKLATPHSLWLGELKPWVCHSVTRGCRGKATTLRTERFSPVWHFFLSLWGTCSQYVFIPVLIYF